MKKIIAMIVLAVMVCTVLCGCNQGFGIGSLKFDRVHIQIDSKCADAHVIKWYEGETDTGIEVTTEEYGSMYLSEGTYIMFNGVCPLCGK